jgi:hypothetical protein
MGVKIVFMNYTNNNCRTSINRKKITEHTICMAWNVDDEKNIVVEGLPEHFESP